jgi:hypothetical protein
LFDRPQFGDFARYLLLAGGELVHGAGYLLLAGGDPGGVHVDTLPHRLKVKRYCFE